MGSTMQSPLRNRAGLEARKTPVLLHSLPPHIYTGADSCVERLHSPFLKVFLSGTCSPTTPKRATPGKGLTGQKLFLLLLLVIVCREVGQSACGTGLAVLRGKNVNPMVPY